MVNSVIPLGDSSMAFYDASHRTPNFGEKMVKLFKNFDLAAPEKIEHLYINLDKELFSLLKLDKKLMRFCIDNHATLSSWLVENKREPFFFSAHLSDVNLYAFIGAFAAAIKQNLPTHCKDFGVDFLETIPEVASYMQKDTNVKTR